MAASFPYSTSAYRCPSPTYRSYANSMYQEASIVYSMTLSENPSTSGRSLSPTKQFQPSAIVPAINSRPNTSVYIPSSAPASIIIPTREWLLDTLKRYIFKHQGILIGDYPKYEIRKKDITNKFHKRVAEQYPCVKYSITKDWLTSAIANPEFLPEYAERLDTFPNTAEFRIAIKQTDFNKLAQDIADNIEKYFNIRVEYYELLDTNINKIILVFCNHFIPDGQRIVLYVDPDSSLTTLGILIPQTDMKYQHDYLAYDGNVYSVLDAYTDWIDDALYNRTGTASSDCYQDISVDISLMLFEIVNNIRNGIVVFMAYVEMEECIEMILASRNIDRNIARNIARNIYKDKNTKKEKQIPMFDKFICHPAKLDFYINIWEPSGKMGEKGCIEACICPRCKVVIESGELVCTTKCCRRTIHPSCLLELYYHEDTTHSEFRCDKCHVQKPDKYGKNTEMLMGLCNTGF